MSNENRVKDGQYINIQAFMIKDLELKGNELLIYAIIYGFSQDEESTFKGNVQYLADWTNSTRQGAMKCLNSLVEKGYIQKIEHAGFANEYFAPPVNKVYNPCKQSLQPVETKFTPPVNKVDSSNQLNNIEDTIFDKKGRFIPPTVEEVRAYCNERKNNVDAEAFVNFYASKGWYVGKNKMKDWKACVITWEKRSANNQVEKPATSYDIEKVKERAQLPIVYKSKK